MVLECYEDEGGDDTRRYLRWMSQGRRPIGRPHKRWLHGVDEALKRREKSLAKVEESEIYEDRKTRERDCEVFAN